MRLGIFGGAFNPVHIGHVIVAIASIEYLELDELLIVPTHIPPHRNPSDLAPFDLRMGWLERAFEGVEKVTLSDFEFRKGGKSYSIDTVRHFSELYSVRPFFIIGEDWLEKMDTWYRFEDLRKMAIFAVYPRFRCGAFGEYVEIYPDFVFMESLPLIEVSSTTVRSRVKEGLSVKGMVPDSILKDVVDFYGSEGR